MPSLNEQQLEELRRVPKIECRLCHQVLTENYCNECDEFFKDGHEPSCRFMKKGTIFEPTDDHRRHRTALRGVIARDVNEVPFKVYTPEHIMSPDFFKRK